MESGGLTSVDLTRRYLERDRGHRSQRPALRSVIETQPRRARDRRRRSTASAQERPHPRTAARRPDPDQGQHRHRRPHGDHGRLAGAGRIAGGARRLPRRASARRRRRHPRQDQPERVGELPLDAVDERLERSRRPDAQPLRARSQLLRLELRLGRRRRREPLRRRDRHRDRRLDRLPRDHQRARRAQAHGRPGQPQRASSRSPPARTRPDR